MAQPGRATSLSGGRGLPVTAGRRTESPSAWKVPIERQGESRWPVPRPLPARTLLHAYSSLLSFHHLLLSPRSWHVRPRSADLHNCRSRAKRTSCSRLGASPGSALIVDRTGRELRTSRFSFILALPCWMEMFLWNSPSRALWLPGDTPGRPQMHSRWPKPMTTGTSSVTARHVHPWKLPFFSRSFDSRLDSFITVPCYSSQGRKIIKF